MARSVRLWPPTRRSQWVAQMMELIRSGRMISNRMMQDYYVRFRAAEGARGRFDWQPPTPLEASTVESTLALAGGTVAPEKSRAAVAGAVQRLSLAAGREAIGLTIQADPVAVGAVRVARANCCAFCGMLAGRAASLDVKGVGLYRSEDTAAFPAHDSCRCGTEPVFDAARYTPPATGQALAEQWDAARNLPSGRIAGSHAAFKEFRRMRYRNQVNGLPPSRITPPDDPVLPKVYATRDYYTT